MPVLPQTYESVPLDAVHPHPRNPRRGDLDVITESITANGFFGACIAQRSTGAILVGNHRWQAARQVGETTVPVLWVDVDDEQAQRIMVADNRTAELAAWDDTALAELLTEMHAVGVDGLAGTGFTDTDLDDLLAGIRAAEPLPEPDTDPDEVSPLPAIPRTEAGDVWHLGPHRLLCGDATDPDAYQVLLGGEQVHLVWTDPPYGVDVVGGNHQMPPAKRRKLGHLTIENDTLTPEALTTFLRAALSATLAVTRPGAPWYVAAPHGPQGLSFSVVLTDLDIWRRSLVWVKDTLVLSRSDYHYRHEPIYYGWTPGAARLHPVEDRTQNTVWEIPRPTSSAEHPTMKPVELITRALHNSSSRGDLVLDPFGGSGSTLIAAHLTDRAARLIELDRAYCDVICRRFQRITSVQPIRDGQPVDFSVLLTVPD